MVQIPAPGLPGRRMVNKPRPGPAQASNQKTTASLLPWDKPVSRNNAAPIGSLMRRPSLTVTPPALSCPVPFCSLATRTGALLTGLGLPRQRPGGCEALLKHRGDGSRAASCVVWCIE